MTPTPRETPRKGEEEEEGEEEESEEEGDPPPDPFTDNPMYPFVVSEPTFLNVALYQNDKR
jgi:hypothetical protein